MRLFVAIELPEVVRRHTLDTIRHAIESANVSAPVSWAKPENVHITLKFLGEMAVNRVPALCDALREVEPPGEMTLWPSHIECFPPNAPVRLVSAGFAGDVEKLQTLFSRIKAACEP